MEWVILVVVVCVLVVVMANLALSVWGRSEILKGVQYISDEQPTLIAILNSIAHRLDRIESKLDKLLEDKDE